MSEHSSLDRFDNVDLAVSQLVRDLGKFMEHWPEEDRRCDALGGTLHFLADLVDQGFPLRLPPEGVLRRHTETLNAKSERGWFEDDDDA